MSNLTARPHVSHLSIDSLTSEKESLSHQLDRLNKVIQGITSDQLSPGPPHCLASPSQDSYFDFSKISYYENEDFNAEFLNQIEKYATDLDRLSMVQEDFRSHEVRENQEFREIVIEITRCEIEEMKMELEKIRSLGDRDSGKIIVGGKRLRFVVRANEKNYPGKDLIQQNLFMKEGKDKMTNKDFQEFQSELEMYMQVSFNESLQFPCGTSEVVQFSRSTYTEIHKSTERALEHQQLINKLEWQCSEISMIKEQYQQKIVKLQEYEKIIMEKKVEIKNEDSKLQTQKLIIAKDQEIIQQQKKIIEQVREDNRKKSEIVKNTLSEVRKNANFIIKPISSSAKPLEKKKSEEAIVLKPRRNEHKGEIDLEIQVVQQEIQNLEFLLQNGPKNSESIQTKIDRLKTKHSNLKSKRVITASLERSNSVSSKISFFERERTFTSTNSKSSFDSQILSSSNKINVLNSKKPPIQSPIKTPEKADGQCEFQKYLKLRENRLSEKDDELTKRENMLMSNLGKNSDGIGLVNVLQTEQRNLKILRNDLEKRQRNLEQEVLAYARRCSEMKAKEREVMNTIESFDAFVYQKKHLENRLQFLLSVFEDSLNI